MPLVHIPYKVAANVFQLTDVKPSVHLSIGFATGFYYGTPTQIVTLGGLSNSYPAYVLDTTILGGARTIAPIKSVNFSARFTRTDVTLPWPVLRILCLDSGMVQTFCPSEENQDASTPVDILTCQMIACVPIITNSSKLYFIAENIIPVQSPQNQVTAIDVIVNANTFGLAPYVYSGIALK